MLSLLKKDVDINKSVAPTESQSAGIDQSMNRPLHREKLSNILEMFENYICRERRIKQLQVSSTLGDAHPENAIPLDENNHHDSQPLRLGSFASKISFGGASPLHSSKIWAINIE